MYALLTFAINLLLLYCTRYLALFLKLIQPQRGITKFAKEKDEQKPIPCGGIFFMATFAIYAYFDNNIDCKFWSIFAFFLIGLLDDIGKIAKKSHLSFMSGKLRLSLEIMVASVFVYFFIASSVYKLDIPKFSLSISIPFIVALPIIVFVIVGTLNAVNLTDGQDGLACKTVLVHLFFIIAICGMNTVTVGVIACLLAFLLFNTKPATVYMGDSGSMFLGAFLVISYFDNKIEYTLPLTGIVFVIETLSVILQVYSFKLTGKRIFKMAPIHHHLEMSGFAEEKTVSLAFVITILACYTAYILII